MNIDKFNSIIKAVRSAYPQFKFIDSKEGAEIWLKALQDVPDEIVGLAFEKYIMTEKFPPSIAEIRAKIIECTGRNINDWTTAFDLTNRAIRNFGSYREAEAIEWIAEQDEVAGEIARRLGFKELCLSENVEVIRGQFRRAYEAYSENMRYKEMLPQSTKEKQYAINENRNIDNIVNVLGQKLSLEKSYDISRSLKSNEK